MGKIEFKLGARVQVGRKFKTPVNRRVGHVTVPSQLLDYRVGIQG